MAIIDLLDYQAGAILLGELAPDSGTVKLGTKLEIAYSDQLRGHLDPEKDLKPSWLRRMFLPRHRDGRRMSRKGRPHCFALMFVRLMRFEMRYCNDMA